MRKVTITLSFYVVVYQAPKANIVSIFSFPLQQLDEKAKVVVPSSDSISEVSSQCYNPSVDYSHHKDLLCLPSQSREDVDTVTSGNVSFLADSLLPQASVHNGNSESAFGDDELAYEENDSMPTAVQDSELLNEDVDQEQRMDDDIASLDLDDWETNTWERESGQSTSKNESDVSFSMEHESGVQKSSVDESCGSSQGLKSICSTEEDSHVSVGETESREDVGDSMDSNEVESRMDDDMELHEDALDDIVESHEGGVDDIVESHEEGVDDIVESHEEGVDSALESHEEGVDDIVESHEGGVDSALESHEEDSPMDEMNSHTDDLTVPSESAHTDVEASSHSDNLSCYTDSVKSHSSESGASLGESDLPVDDGTSHMNQLSVTQEDLEEAPPLRIPSSLVPTSILRKNMGTKSKSIAHVSRPKEPSRPVKTPPESPSCPLSPETPLVLSTSDLFLNSTPSPTSPA